MTPGAEALRWIPAVHACVAEPPEAVRVQGAGERLEREALERALADVRAAVRERPDAFARPQDVTRAVDAAWAAALAVLLAPALAPVVNATGVVVHTNLGRAPLAAEAADAARAAAMAYTPLEYDLARGKRGSRYAHAASLLRAATGAEDALVVNNNAAALLLAVDSLAGGAGVVISRGELIEIGGGFRIHEILARSSARLVEVGSTNKTHADDYRAAIRSGGIGALLKVHRSNFAQTGFVGEVPLEGLCAIGAEAGLPVVFDQGSGVLEPFGAARGEPSVEAALAAGAALVCASGDKLLGGPQAGIVAGGAEWIARLRANPLLRALRVDKMTIAALEATLRLALSAPERIPVRRMMEADAGELEARARRIVAALGSDARACCEAVPHAGRAGGGTLPDVDLPGWAVRVRPGSAAGFEAALRAGRPPIVARVADDAVWIDVRTLLPGDEEIVAARCEELLGGAGTP